MAQERSDETKDPFPPLEEKDFVQELRGKEPMPLWLFMALVAALFAAFWLGGNWLFTMMERQVEKSTFLQVTNRDLSLFLYENPELMRIHAPNKTGYLPGFRSDAAAGPKVDAVDDIAVAPPEVLFLYHTWERLLSDYVIPRPIPSEEFQQFLQASPEWLPDNWPQASEEYKEFIKEFALVQREDLHSFPYQVLPKNVRKAFYGWKNYYKEGDLINQQRPQAGEVRTFVEQYPHFARNYWKNIVPHYLKSLGEHADDSTEEVKEEEIPPFLRVALYNWKESE